MDINTASAEELQRAFEVDGEQARFIIEKRYQMGGFKNWNQIKEIVPSIEAKTVENLNATHSLNIKGTQENRRERDASGYKSVYARNVKTNPQEQSEQVCQVDAGPANCPSQEPGSLDLWSSPEGRLIFTLAMFIS
jgi:hypothetical protein